MEIGEIDHKASIDKIVYKDNCNMTIEFKTRFNTIKAKPMVDYIIDNFSYLNKMAETDPYELFIKLCENKVDYFGTTYIITILYFLSNGVMPIYEKFAHVALLSISNNVRPNESVHGYKSLDSSKYRSSWEIAWGTYKDYCNLLVEVVGEGNYINRAVDRSL